MMPLFDMGRADVRALGGMGQVPDTDGFEAQLMGRGRGAYLASTLSLGNVLSVQRPPSRQFPGSERLGQ
jgi:hypothetical protein